MTEQWRTGTPQGVERFEFKDLDWTDVADIVWLAAASTPRRTGDEVTPGKESKPTSDQVWIRNAPSERGEILPPPEPRLSQIPGVTPSSDGDSRVVEIDAVPGELPEPAVEGSGQGGAVLLESLEYFRALRKLKRETPSLRHNNGILDEVETAVRAAETGRRSPVTRSRNERWLDLTLVLDNGPCGGGHGSPQLADAMARACGWLPRDPST
ncbi:hypothetical protein DL990_40860 [Amycolatopsis sp. WAC 01416]|uniref:hypothetical protein n=1 Tax=Amycolatopsis sp. WAC 01416 TaxID=2203196 RepID=UPI000F7B9414|nr:hypothetical protein [Amycolatopsis sp. WAC 01416]RSN19919.1 hypothetical protein DL990_40860 [Amycolatopsis sp. WAC 01416]